MRIEKKGGFVNMEGLKLRRKKELIAAVIIYHSLFTYSSIHIQYCCKLLQLLLDFDTLLPFNLLY
jgi:hypothetical protein